MKGKFYEMDEWLKMVDDVNKKDFSEGAKWWLNRIRTRTIS